MKPLRTEWQQRRFALDATPCAQDMVDHCEAWCRNFAVHGAQERCIVLSGPFGCGKSRALRASKTYVRDVRLEVWPQHWPHPAQFHFVEWGNFIRELTEKENPDAADDLLAADVVFLDDIGSEEDRFKSGAPTRILGDILGTLHDMKRFVFITTNIEPRGWKDRWDGRVEDRLMRLNAIVLNLWKKQSESYAALKLKQEA